MKGVRIILVLLFFLVFLFVWVFPQLPGLWWAGHGGYVRYSPSLLADQAIDRKELKDLQLASGLAEEKIAEFWGGRLGKGQIIYCRQEETFRKLCSSGSGAGCSIGTPWGAWIVLSREGLNENVIAHEMCHVELMERLGWWKVKRHVPTWLDEGLALQTDDRFVESRDSLQRYIDFRAELEMYSLGNQYAIPLRELETNRQFFSGNEAETRIAYLTAATQVAVMLAGRSRRDFLRELQQDPEKLVAEISEKNNRR